ncbi:MAG: Ig-like domain-containing protein, partial [Acutalibacteraceae bacterium]
MKKYAVRAAAIMLAVIIASSSVFAASAAALEELTGVKSPIISAIESFFSKTDGQEVPNGQSGEAEGSAYALVVSSESMTVTVGKTVKMTASVSGVDAQPAINWKSSDTSVATVSADGVVKGIKAGKSTITATAVVNGKTLTGEFVINVITRSNFIKDYLSKHQVLSYQYSYIDDYYYT